MKHRTMFVISGLLLVAALFINGCEEKKPAPTAVDNQPTTANNQPQPEVEAEPVEKELSPLKKDALAATGLIYSKSVEDGRLKFLCMATAFDKTDNVYQFVTVTTCFPGEKKIKPANLYINFGQKDKTTFYPAEIVSAENWSEDEVGFVVLEAKIDKPLPIISFSSNHPEDGEQVFSFYKLAQMRTLFAYGQTYTVSRYPFEGDIAVQPSGLLTIGAPVVSYSQKSVVAIIYQPIMAERGGSTTYYSIAVPATRFHHFLKKMHDSQK